MSYPTLPVKKSVKTVTVRIDAELVAKVKALCKQNGLTLTEVVDWSLRFWHDQQIKK